MIESSIVSWANLSYDLTPLDAFKKKFLVKFFNLMRFLLSFKKFSILMFILLKFLFFLQIMMLTLTQLNDKYDNAIKILKYISTVIFIQEIVSEETTYKIAILINSIITITIILCVFNAILSIKMERVYFKIPIVFLNLLNLVIKEYLIGPIIQISMLSTKCTGGLHAYLNVECYTNTQHIIILIVSIANLIFYFIYSILLSVYYNEIGSIDQAKLTARINTNYEIYSNIVKILMFVFAYFVNNYQIDSLTYKLLLQFFIMVWSFGFFIYVYRNVLFYDRRVNRTILYGWILVSWFSLVICMKTLLDINDTTIILLVGWLVISCIIYYLEEFKIDFLLSEFNIFNAKNLKDIEFFKMNLFNLMNMRCVKSQTFLAGIIKKFEDYILNNKDLEMKYVKICSNEFLINKYNGNNLKCVVIMNLIYEYQLEKSEIKEDILFCYSYFLVSIMRNNTLACYLCSRMKVKSHKHIYYKYTILEDIKDYLVNRILKTSNKEAIKNVQIGSVILYDTYLNSFRSKICEAIGLQMEYLETLRSRSTSKSTTQSFLTYGEKILNLRKTIFKIWERIIELNPFSDEAWNDYELYLDLVLQDDIMLRTERKKYLNIKSSKLSERNSTYNSMFDPNSSVLLIDGYSNFGNIVYCTPSFPHLFNFREKEVLNSNIDNFVPSGIGKIHKEIVEYSLKYSNIGYIFKKEREMLLKSTKTDGIFSIKLYLKVLPNLSNGLIYISSVKKIIENNYVVILDRDLKINALPDPIGISPIIHSYILDQNLIGSFAGHILPEILLQIDYKQDEGFVFIKNDVELKGNLYILPPKKELNDYIGMILKKIKLYGRIQVDDNRQESLADYEELVKELNSISTFHHSVFFKFVSRSFYEGKMKYHKIIISSDMITINENSKINKNLRVLKKNSSQKSLNQIFGFENNKKESLKQIKIKLHHGEDNMATGEERNKLLEEHKFNLIDKLRNDELEKDNEMENLEEKESRSHQSYYGTSAGSKSSLDSTSFNKLKNGILSEKEISLVKIMKYFTFLFGLGAIALVFFSTQNSKDKFTEIQKYLSQNLFFNHTKILVSCIYYSTLNMKFLKNSLYTDDYCYFSCNSLYDQSLTECVNDVKTAKDYKNLIYDDYKQILAQKSEIELEIFHSDQLNKVKINVDSYLNLLVTFGLKFKADLREYFLQQNSELDTLSINILTQSRNFLDDDLIKGFNETEIEKNLKHLGSNVNVPLIIQICLFTILIFLFIYFFCSFYSIESYYLTRLVKFRNIQFDAYIKKLEIINKAMKSNQGREEDQVIEELDVHNEFLQQDETSQKKRHKIAGDDNEDKKEKNKAKDKDKDDIQNRGKIKNDKKQNKRNKPYFNYREEKIKIMKSYFLNWNIIFTLNVILILFLSASYYIVLSSFDSSTIRNMLQLDTTINSIEGVYKESFDIYLSLKSELNNYIDYELNKKKNGKFDNKYYLMNIPSDISLPRLGNLLINLVNIDTAATLSSTSTASTPSTFSYSEQSTLLIYNLYNTNACDILFDSTVDVNDYNYCISFWSGILTKGIEQSVTQMNIAITSLLDDFYSLNIGKKTLDQIIASGSHYNTYEFFVEFYLFKAYLKTYDLFKSLKDLNLSKIHGYYESIMITYMCITFILFISLLYFVYKAKFIFSCFMNFIGIIPAKFLIEDASFYRDIIRLERYIYY